jgi:hypothetical protein
MVTKMRREEDVGFEPRDVQILKNGIHHSRPRHLR